MQRYGGDGYAIAVATGPVPPSITGLAPGLPSWVRVSALGRLERAASPAGVDDVVGWCDASGLLHANFGVPFNASAIVPDFARSSIAGWDQDTQQWIELVEEFAANPADSHYAVFQSAQGDGGPPIGVPLGLLFASFAAVEDGSLVVVDIQDGNPVGLRSGVLVVNQIDGDATLGNVVANHSRYNWADEFEVGRIGRTIIHSFASLASGLITDLPWASSRSGVLEVRACFTQTGLLKRILRTYAVERTSAGTLTVTEIGSGASEHDAIAGTDVVLSAAGSTLRLTISNATSGATNVVCSVEGERLVVP